MILNAELDPSWDDLVHPMVMIFLLWNLVTADDFGHLAYTYHLKLISAYNNKTFISEVLWNLLVVVSSWILCLLFNQQSLRSSMGILAVHLWEPVKF